MTTTGLQTCQPQAVRLVLIEEALLTAVAVTPDTAERYGRAITFERTDPRVGAVKKLLDGLVVEATPHEMIELRALLRLTCSDGTRTDIVLSSTQPDGRIYLLHRGKVVSTTMPVRSRLEALYQGNS